MSLESALEGLAEVAPAPLDIAPSDGRAAEETIGGSRHVTIMAFSASEADVFAIADALRMEKSGLSADLAADPGSIYPSVTSGADGVPSWFSEWEGKDVVAFGMLTGDRLVFVAVAEGGEGLRVFLKHERHYTGVPFSPVNSLFCANFNRPGDRE
jgi:hypothetical protein